jgi:uncharacterized protein
MTIYIRKMNRKEQINITEQFVRTKMAHFDGGHDWWHVMRVRNIALFINSVESMADSFTLEIAALLHDTADSKFTQGSSEGQYQKIKDFMTESGMEEIRDQVIGVIRNVSFSSKNTFGNSEDPVLLILQDADRLDAIGALGIARAFNYGGYRNRPLFDPAEQDYRKGPSTIDHFYDKLLKLKDMMNTITGREIAEERHAFLEHYLVEFYKEWNFAIKPLQLPGGA